MPNHSLRRARSRPASAKHGAAERVDERDVCWAGSRGGSDTVWPGCLRLFTGMLGREVPFEVDTYWVQAGGVNPAGVVAGFGQRMSHLHVVDGPAVPGEPQVAVGDGVVEAAGVLGANEAVRWHIVELGSCAGDTREAVRASYDYLVGNGLPSGHRPVSQ